MNATVRQRVPWLALVGGVLAVIAAMAVAIPRAQTGDARTLHGSWSATGRVQTLATEGERPASVAQISGAVVLTDDSGAPAGFQGQAISFDNGSGSATGRAVWTDSRGDRLFALLQGQSLGAGRHVVGTFTGGSGRFKDVEGGFELTWQYVVNGDDDAVQGRTSDLVVHYQLKGRRP